MRAGRRDERITIQEPVETAGSYGETDIIWIDLPEVWANVSPKKGREFFAAQQVNNVNPVLFTINYRKEINDTYRVLYDCKTYEIRNITGYRKRNEHQLICSEIT